MPASHNTASTVAKLPAKSINGNATKLAIYHAMIALFFFVLWGGGHYFCAYIAANDPITTQAFLHNARQVKIAHIMDYSGIGFITLHLILATLCALKLKFARILTIVIGIIYLFAFPLTIIAFGFMRYTTWYDDENAVAKLEK